MTTLVINWFCFLKVWAKMTSPDCLLLSLLTMLAAELISVDSTVYPWSSSVPWNGMFCHFFVCRLSKISFGLISLFHLKSYSPPHCIRLSSRPNYLGQSIKYGPSRCYSFKYNGSRVARLYLCRKAPARN